MQKVIVVQPGEKTGREVIDQSIKDFGYQNDICYVSYAEEDEGSDNIGCMINIQPMVAEILRVEEGDPELYNKYVKYVNGEYEFPEIEQPMPEEPIDTEPEEEEKPKKTRKTSK